MIELIWIDCAATREVAGGGGEGGVNADVSDANEEGKAGGGDEGNGEGGAVVEELIADYGVEEEDPGGGGDEADVDGGEPLEVNVNELHIK